ncbi:hypothetical protein [Dyadobacter tibetensis]|uniref:hypothetical protein n=1 Tax=Dyadobacter tibetensis TaxID=1211851 RepID=UPI00047068C0|nr:hypothetical protein [Dyadobacter tibetensis]
MKIKLRQLILCMVLGLTACRTAELHVGEDLKAGTTVLTVKGRQGFQIGQVLRFGEYSTSKVERGWTNSFRIPFIVSFSGAKEKLSFQQFGPGKQFARVAMVSKIRSTEVDLFREYFTISGPVRNIFAGGIELSNTKENWEFWLEAADGAALGEGNKTLGYLRSTEDHLQISVEGIRQLEGRSAKFPTSQVYGYAFRMDGKLIGAVSIIDAGKVWTRDNIHPEIKLVLASVYSGLLLRNNLQEVVEEL